MAAAARAAARRAGAARGGAQARGACAAARVWRARGCFKCRAQRAARAARGAAALRCAGGALRQPRRKGRGRRRRERSAVAARWQDDGGPFALSISTQKCRRVKGVGQHAPQRPCTCTPVHSAWAARVCGACSFAPPRPQNARARQADNHALLLLSRHHLGYHQRRQSRSFAAAHHFIRLRLAWPAPGPVVPAGCVQRAQAGVGAHRRQQHVRRERLRDGIVRALECVQVRVASPRLQ